MKKNHEVFIVEDDQILLGAIVEFLRGKGVLATGFSCSDELNQHLVFNQPSILILDINLPGENGYEIARRLRPIFPSMPIIMLSDLKTEFQRIHGYEVGADVYLPKPISPVELLSVIKSACRRLEKEGLTSSLVHFHFKQSMLEHCGRTVGLNSMEKHLLMALIQAPEQTLPKWRLLEIIINAAGIDDAEDAYLEMQVFRLRKKILSIGADSPSIKSVRNKGYKLLLGVDVLFAPKADR